MNLSEVRSLPFWSGVRRVFRCQDSLSLTGAGIAEPNDVVSRLPQRVICGVFSLKNKAGTDVTHDDVLKRIAKLIQSLPDDRETVDSTITALVTAAALMLCGTTGKAVYGQGIRNVTNAGLTAMGTVIDAIGGGDVQLN